MAQDAGSSEAPFAPAWRERIAGDMGRDDGKEPALHRLGRCRRAKRPASVRLTRRGLLLAAATPARDGGAGEAHTVRRTAPRLAVRRLAWRAPGHDRPAAGTSGSSVGTP